MFPMRVWVAVVFIMLVTTVAAKPRRILLDTDVDLDDVFALLYLLKLNRSEFQLEGLEFCDVLSLHTNICRESQSMQMLGLMSDML